MLEKIQNISQSKDYKPGSSFVQGKRPSDGNNQNQQSFNDKLTLSAAIKHLLSLGWRLYGISSSSDPLQVSVGIGNYTFRFFLTEENLEANGRLLFNMQRSGNDSETSNPVLHFNSVLSRVKVSSDSSPQSLSSIFMYYEDTVKDFPISDESDSSLPVTTLFPQRMLADHETGIEFVIKNLIKFVSAYINSQEETSAVPPFKCETEITGIG